MSKQSSPELPRPADTQLGAAVHYVLKPILVLLTAATIYSSFKAGQQYFNSEGEVLCPFRSTLPQSLLDDCLRLGVVWPSLNLLLSVLPPAGLLFRLVAKKRSSRSLSVTDKLSAPTPTDSEADMRTMVVAVSLAAAIVALAFIHVSLSALPAGVLGYHMLYWRSNMAFWQVLSLTCSYDLLDFMACTSDKRRTGSLVFQASVVVAIMMQLALCAPVEGALTFVVHASEPMLPSMHLRFVLVSTLTAAVALYFTLRTCLLRFRTHTCG
ncbi:hypothetical protein GGH13_002344 [Coemansia sp. S155-1]|nr:hypothetical protein GGH13_002344 [Coemansia sp. S155-1]